MAAAAEPFLITVDQYRQLPDREDVVQELHFGMVVTLSRPKMRHAKLQVRLRTLLGPKAVHLGVVETEVAFRALPEYELRGADVAFVTQQRWDSTADDDNLHGSPEIVIEILSPSNTKAKIHEKAVLCLSTGALEFWVVDPKRKTVSVTPKDGPAVVYGVGDRIPLPLFSSDLAVSAIFS
jgi:Uma2 family endonuclease